MWSVIAFTGHFLPPLTPASLHPPDIAPRYKLVPPTYGTDDDFRHGYWILRIRCRHRIPSPMSGSNFQALISGCTIAPPFDCGELLLWHKKELPLSCPRPITTICFVHSTVRHETFVAQCPESSDSPRRSTIRSSTTISSIKRMMARSCCILVSNTSESVAEFLTVALDRHLVHEVTSPVCACQPMSHFTKFRTHRYQASI